MPSKQSGTHEHLGQELQERLELLHQHEKQLERYCAALLPPDQGDRNDLTGIGSAHSEWEAAFEKIVPFAPDATRVEMRRLQEFVEIPLGMNPAVRWNFVTKQLRQIKRLCRDLSDCVYTEVKNELQVTGRYDNPSNAVYSSEADIDDSTTTRAESLEGYVRGNSATLTIVFTDIVDSTPLNAKLGDNDFDLLCDAHFRKAREVAARHNGCEAKDEGDGLEFVFKSPLDGLDFALALFADTGHELASIRVGIHDGLVSIANNKATGQTVIRARRVTDCFKHPGIFVSDVVKNKIDQVGRPVHKALCWKRHDDQVLKGLNDNHTLWEVVMSSQ